MGKSYQSRQAHTDANMIRRPASVSKDKFSAKDAGSGQPVGELDEVTRLKAEAKHFLFYEFFCEPDPKATGVADFH